MVYATHRKSAYCRSNGPTSLVLWVVLLLTMGFVGESFAFSTSLKYSTEDLGKREILSFSLPPGSVRPRLELMDLQTLRVTVPGVLALPANTLDTERSRWISDFKVEGIPSGELGINVFIELRKPNLSFRDSLGETDPIAGTPYRLEIDQLPPPSDAKETEILEGRTLAGRDGTLVVISRTGSSPVETLVELEAHVVRIHWQNASLNPGWRPVKSQGLAERLLAYDFSKDEVEMELLLHKDVVEVEFHQDAEAGLFIIELSGRSDLGRTNDAKRLLSNRKAALASGVVLPLNRLDPVFIPRYDITLELQGQIVTENFYMKAARESAKDHKFSLARAYLDKLLQLFPDSPNRELIETYKLDLAKSMKWKPGWLLAELENLLAKYPNMLRYPHHRLEQLHLLNRVTRYEEAAAIMWDPNMPKERPDLWLERGYTAMGLARFGLGEASNWQSAKKHLNRALELSHNKGDISAETNYLLARMAQERRTNGGKETLRILAGLSSEQMARIANHPEWLMAIGDIYYENRLYPQAFKYYSQFITNYPGVNDILPWAILRAAESSRQMGRHRDARRLFGTLQKHYSESEGAAWGRVFELRMDKTKDVTKRLQKLNTVIKSIALADVLSEALRIKAELQGTSLLYKDALRTLNNLLSLSSRDRVVINAKKLKRDYLIAGMQRALANDRPEHAILLAEMHGEDWRADPTFLPARVGLAEALLRIGLWEEGLKLLDGIFAPPVPGLTKLAKALSQGRWPEVSVAQAFASLSTPAGREEEPNRSSNSTTEALSAIEESVPAVGDGIPTMARNDIAPLDRANLAQESPAYDATTTEMITVEEARVRLDEASRLMFIKEWDGILNLLEQLPSNLLNNPGQVKRLLFMAKAEAGRNRFPQAVGHMETLFSGQEIGDGDDFYWYATLLQKWKGDSKALPVFDRASKEAKNKEVQSLAHIRIGDIMQRSGDFTTAIKQYRTAASLAPTTPWSKVAAENASQLEMAMEVTQ